MKFEEHILSQILQYQKNIFDKFTTLKWAFQSILHRKVVHKILQKYTNHHQFIPKFEEQGYTEEPQNIIILSQQLPQFTQLQTLKLNLTYSNLGKNANLIKFLGQELSILPSLKNLFLELEGNNLGSNPQSLQILGNYLKKLSSLQHLHLNLRKNQLNINVLNLKLLLENLKESKKLKSLSLNLERNNLGENPLNMKNLGEGLKLLQFQVQCLSLFLGFNELSEDRQNIKLFGQIFVYLKRLVSFDFDINNNGFEKNLAINYDRNIHNLLYDDNNNNELQSNSGFNYMIYCLEILGEGLGQLRSLQKLKFGFPVYLEGNVMDIYDQNIISFRKGFQELKQLRQLHIQVKFFDNGRKFQNLDFLTEIINGLVFLDTLNLDISQNELSDKKERIWALEGFFQNLVNVENLSVNLSENNLGFDAEGMKILAVAVKKLRFVQKFKLNLSRNNIGKFRENIRYFASGLIGLYSIRELCLDFSENVLGLRPEKILMLEQGLIGLPFLSNLQLILKKNRMTEVDQSKIEDLILMIFSVPEVILKY